MTYADDEFEELVGSEIIKNQDNNKMDNGLFKLTKENLYSAVVYGFVLAALIVISKGTVFGLDWKMLVDAFITGALTSVVKNIFTTSKGNFGGVIPVIPETK